MSEQHRAGMVAVVGRPNVGKSTLLNALVGAKVSIVSRRPQTTRHRIMGIVTRENMQIAFIDTPGFQAEHGGALNKLLNRSVTASLSGVDVVLWLVEAGRVGALDRRVLGLLPRDVPVIAGVSKVDRLKSRSQLLPFVQLVSGLYPFAEVVPFSALRGDNLDRLIEVIRPLLPVSPALYSADTITDRSERFIAAEFIREKLFYALGEELPYSAAVVVDRFEEEGGLRRIYASIIVDKDSQKSIVIGQKGERLKGIASRARRDMEALFGGKVYLEVWVRVKRGWADDARSLRALGYE